MTHASHPAPANQVPLVVDLDGTLIRTDMMWESLVRLLRRNPFAIFAILFWWARGRARLKQKLAAKVQVDPATLPYCPEFLAWLREQKRSGRKIILATASDLKMAEPVARHVGLFDEVLASDGKTNLRGAAKLVALTKKFGERGFDYAGNSSVDLAVWKGSREAIVVNASQALATQAAQQTKLGPLFLDGYSRWFHLRRILSGLLIESRYLPAAGAGVVLALAFPKSSIAGLAWIAPALMLAAARGRRGAEAFRIGYVAGFALQLVLLRWLCEIPVTGFPILGWVLLSAFLALYHGVWVWLVSSFEFRVSSSWLARTRWALLGAAAWVTMEMIQARFLSGFPWNFIGASQYELTPLIQIASLTGVYGVSFVVVWSSLSLFNAVASLAAQPDRRFAWQKEIILPLVVVVALFKVGMDRVRSSHDEANPTLRVTFVQPSIPQTVIWNAADSDQRFAELMKLTEQALTRPTWDTNQSDLLLWPEAAVPKKIRYDDDTYRSVMALAKSNHVWLIVGSDDAEPSRHPRNTDDVDYFNASFLVSPDGELAARYCKRNLVIFGEYIPLVRWLPFLTWFVPGSEGTVGFTSGEKPVTFELNHGVAAPVKTSTLICFEDTFPQLVREYVDDDTDFLVNLTNDGWFGESAEQWQHATSAAFRAVENGVPLLRCCNNGLTCWVDAQGRVQQIFADKSGDIHGAGFMTARIPLPPTPGKNRGPTFYNRHGDWFGWLCVALAGPVLLARIPTTSRRRWGDV